MKLTKMSIKMRLPLKKAAASFTASIDMFYSFTCKRLYSGCVCVCVCVPCNESTVCWLVRNRSYWKSCTVTNTPLSHNVLSPLYIYSFSEPREFTKTCTLQWCYKYLFLSNPPRISNLLCHVFIKIYCHSPKNIHQELMTLSNLMLFQKGTII